MNRLIVLIVLACAATTLLASPASAVKKLCPLDPPRDYYERIHATNVSCKRAKQVMRTYFAGDMSPYGYSCRQKQYPGGVTTICRKGDRRIKHLSAD